MNKEEVEELQQAVETIKKYLPKIEEQIEKAEEIESDVYHMDLYEFAASRNAGVRLLNCIKSGEWYNVNEWGKYKVSDFVKSYSQKDFRAVRNCGASTVIDLREMLWNEGIRWD